MSKSRNHKWNDDYEDCEYEKADEMSRRRDAKKDKLRNRDLLMSNTDNQEKQ